MLTKNFITVVGLIFAAAMALMAISSQADEIGEIGVDWLGNDIIVEYVADPQVKGVGCHIAYFERGLFDRLQKGNWFEDPSNSAIECQQVGPIEIADEEAIVGQQEIFKSRKSLIWKKLVVKRLFDESNNTLVYVAHSRELQQGSAKMAISTVPLNDK